MLDPLDFEKRPFLTMLSRKRRLTALVLFAENCGKGLWRIASWVALFAGLWLMQAPLILGNTAAILFSITFFLGLAYFIRKDIKLVHKPTLEEIDRRLEIESDLHHRPLSAIEDRLVNPKKAPTRELWRQNQDDAVVTLKGLRVPVPQPLLSGSDTMAFRSLAALFLLVGLVAAGPQWQDRLVYGIFPVSFGQPEQKVTPVTLWITPPEYTALAQMILQGKGKHEETIKVPEGSILKIRVNDGITQPHLLMGETEIPLEKLGDKSWGVETAIMPGDKLVLKQWPFTKADISYEYIIDRPPTITMSDAPEELAKGEMKMALKVQDDYGVTDLTMRMDLDASSEDKPLGSPYEETRAVMSPPATEIDFTPVFDLSWHPWAGMPVVIEVEGTDHPGQKSDVIPLHVTLPERSFSHPVARKLIDFRKRLIWTPDEAASNISYDLEDLLNEYPQFQGDLVVFLAIRSAASRLAYEPTRKDIVAVIELLWDTALRIEEGNLPLAARDLRDAQRNLEQVLRNPNASDEEIAKAMQELREAMAEYFQEMYKELQKRMAQNGEQMQIPPEMLQQMIQPQDMASFLDKLQAEALSGDKDAARELLSQLQQFMDMLNPSMDMAMPPQMEFMMEGINEMQELIEEQQALLDQTQQQLDRVEGKNKQAYPDFMPFDQEDIGRLGLDNMPPPPQPNTGNNQQNKPKIDTQQNQIEQDALRYILGQLMLETDEQLGEIPENMQNAEQEMRGSAQKLGENNPALSIPHQEKAIEYLQQAMQDMAQKMQQMMQQMTMLSFGGAGQMDPLGRPMQEGDNPGLFPGSQVKIPDEAERKRVQEILKILRQRSGEISRPDYELEYYRRLMKQF